MIVKTEAGQLGTALAFIEEKWKKMNPDAQFEFEILEDTIKQMYISEENFRDIVGSLYNIFGAMSRKKLCNWEKMIVEVYMEFSGEMV